MVEKEYPSLQSIVTFSEAQGVKIAESYASNPMNSGIAFARELGSQGELQGNSAASIIGLAVFSFRRNAMALCLVRGTGDVGSAVAHVLFCSGHRVVLHDDLAPAHSRRGMAFVDAIFDGLAKLGDVLGKRARDPDDLPYMVRCGRAVPVSRDNFSVILGLLRPDILVDARMRKRHRPRRQIGLAPLTIGLGPNFIAGDNTDIAVETGWGEDLGRVIRSGATRPLEGEPNPIHGVARERYVYSPAAGFLLTNRTIGERVIAGDKIAVVGELTLTAPISGCIRGLTRHGVRVEVGTKVIEIDPRNDPALVFGLDDRPKTIAVAVLSAVS